MPIYEYRCTSCGESSSGLEKVGAARVKKCPACGRRTFSRLVSAAAFRLKGGGWYETDFKNKGKPPAAKDGDKGGDKTSGGKDKDGGKDGGNKDAKKPAPDKASTTTSDKASAATKNKVAK